MLKRYGIFLPFLSANVHAVAPTPGWGVRIGIQQSLLLVPVSVDDPDKSGIRTSLKAIKWAIAKMCAQPSLIQLLSS